MQLMTLLALEKQEVYSFRFQNKSEMRGSHWKNLSSFRFLKQSLTNQAIGQCQCSLIDKENKIRVTIDINDT